MFFSWLICLLYYTISVKIVYNWCKVNKAKYDGSVNVQGDVRKAGIKVGVDELEVAAAGGERRCRRPSRSPVACRLGRRWKDRNST